jgi:hypothetical protein
MESEGEVLPRGGLNLVAELLFGQREWKDFLGFGELCVLCGVQNKGNLLNRLAYFLLSGKNGRPGRIVSVGKKRET